MKKFKLKRSTTSNHPATTATGGKLPKSGLPRSWHLFRAALADYRRDLRAYLEILAIVAIPTNLLLLLPLFSQDPLASSYISFASIAMNVALIWAMAERQEYGEMPGIRRAYYDGSVALIRFLLITFALVLMLVPAGLGLAIFTVSFQASQYFGIYGPELVLTGVLAFILSIPSIFLLVRYGLAPYIAVRDGYAPVAALRLSWALTRRKFWATGVRALGGLVFFVLLSVPIALATFGLSLVLQNSIPTAFFQIVATLTVLPIANLYALRLLAHLDGQATGTVRAEEAAEESNRFNATTHNPSQPAVDPADPAGLPHHRPHAAGKNAGPGAAKTLDLR